MEGSVRSDTLSLQLKALGLDTGQFSVREIGIMFMWCGIVHIISNYRVQGVLEAYNYKRV